MSDESMPQGESVPGAVAEQEPVPAVIRPGSQPQRGGILWLGVLWPAFVALDLWILWGDPSWQGWLALGGTMTGLVLIAGAGLVAGRSRGRLGAVLGLIGLGTLLVTHQLALAGLVAPLVLVGGVTLVLGARLAWPGRRLLWLAPAVVFIACALGIEFWEPLTRRAIQGRLAAYALPAAIAALALAFIAWFLVRVGRSGSIRTRLVISYSLMALLPVALLGGTALNQTYQTQRDRVEAELELAAERKEAAIELWLEQLGNDLDNVLAGGELSRRAGVLLEGSEAAVATENTDLLRERFVEIMGRSGRLDEIFMLDRYGRVILSTDADQEGKAYNNEIFFQRGRLGPYVQAPYTTPAAEHRLITLVQPVRNAGGETIGLLGARANLNLMNRIMAEPSRMGLTGETFLVGRNQRLLTEPTAGAEKGEYVTTVAVQSALDDASSGRGIYVNHRGESVIGVFRWLPTLQAVLLAEQARSEAFRPVYATLATVGLVTLITLGLATLVAWLSARAIARPLTNLAQTATEIAGGNLVLTAPLDRRDEIGTLARAFNQMTGQLRALIAGLEERVADRTRALQERSRHLEAAAMVGSAAALMLESDTLIRRVVDLIRDHFDLYYVGLFLVDDTGQWAALRAGTGGAGARLVAQGHGMSVGEGMVGWTIKHGESRVAGDATRDALRLWVDELPETRSEAAIPLRVRGRTIGALSVQDREPGTFDEPLLAALQMMADQVAVALENARLFTEAQEALEAVQRAYGEMTGQAWAELLQLRPALGFRSTERGLSGAGAVPTEAAVAGDHALSLPIQVRGHLVGTLETQKPTEWTPEETVLLNKVVDQLGAALENARLYEESQRRAAREQVARQIAEKLRALTHVETIANTAADELGRALGTDASIITLGVAESTPGNGRQQRRADERSHERGGTAG